MVIRSNLHGDGRRYASRSTNSGATTLRPRSRSGRGVYLIFDRRHRLIYVGSTIHTFDGRIWRYNLPDQARIDLICFDDRHAPFALALELFLIARCKPTYNTVGAKLDL